VVVASAGGISGANDPVLRENRQFPALNTDTQKPHTHVFTSHMVVIVHPKRPENGHFPESKSIDPELSGILMSIRTAPEQKCRKTAPLPLATGSLPVSLPAYCNSRRFFIGCGESAYSHILPVAIVAIQSSRISFFCRQQMAMSLTIFFFPIATVASRVPPKYIFFRQPGGQYIFSSPIWRRIATNAPTGGKAFIGIH
jgi:hypothetical protein